MATYKDSAGNGLYLYNISGATFPTVDSDAYWPCAEFAGSSSSSYYPYDTPFKMKSGTSYNNIKRVSPDEIWISGSGNPNGTSVELTIYPITAGDDVFGSNIYRSTVFQTEIKACDESVSYSGADVQEVQNCTGPGMGFTYYEGDDNNGTEIVNNWTGSGAYFLCGYPTTAKIYIKAVTPIGTYYVSNGVYMCSSSAKQVGAASCCENAMSGCSCSDNSESSSCGNASVNAGCSCYSASGHPVGCVSEDTLILTENGYKKAKDITSKDRLLSYKDGKLVKNDSQISIFIMKEKNSIYRVTFDDDSTLFITPNHPILCDDSKYRTPDEINHELIERKGKIFAVTTQSSKEIRKIEYFKNNGVVYNFLVNEDNFIANDIVLACENIDDEKEILWITASNDGVSVKNCSGDTEGLAQG